MNQLRRRIAYVLIALPPLLGLSACGGTQAEIDNGVDGADIDACVAVSCGLNSTWSASQCRCVATGGSVTDSASKGLPDSANSNTAYPDAPVTGSDAAVDAPIDSAPDIADAGINHSDAPVENVPDTGIADTSSDAVVATHDAMADVSSSHDSSTGFDATPPSTDATFGAPDSADADSSTIWIVPDAMMYDVVPSFDSPAYQDVVTSPYCPPFPYSCPNGYTMNSTTCGCELCSMTCPAGETPGPNCQSCIACPYSCPAGYDVGPSCSCTPHVTDSGVPTGDANPGVPDAETDASEAGSRNCLLGGNMYCNAGSWCQMGVCPDGTTQYGCYCNSDGTSTCSLNCPGTTSCDIPGEPGVCPLGVDCMYGTCSSSSSTVLICNCYNNGAIGIGYGGGTGSGGGIVVLPPTMGGSGASCYTTTCGDLDAGNGFDGGPINYYVPDGGPVPPACLIEGYLACPVGQFCALGTCPSGTPYGCTCNADGGANCNMNCGTTDCDIPGEGICPDGTSCNFGSCADAGASILTCSCYGGAASCYTSSC